jgi:4-diphosphocytidyl-2-C-methyl-D-erythritol kinase
MSLFLRLPSVETLVISGAENADDIRIPGMKIEGENIVTRALRHARLAGFAVPFLNVEIRKTLPPGSGLGAGSGNGAAVLRWLAQNEDDRVWRDVALKTGSDVPFLFSGLPLARVSGTGEKLESLAPLAFYALVVFPDWSVGTANAYGRLDLRYGGKYPLSETQAREEIDLLHRRLRNGERTGLLPNDFMEDLTDRFPAYEELFALFDSAGSSGWGITGSGGAVFALFHEMPALRSLEWPRCVRRILSVDMKSPCANNTGRKERS